MEHNIIRIPTEAELREDGILSSDSEDVLLDNDLEDPMYAEKSTEDYEEYLDSTYKI